MNAQISGVKMDIQGLSIFRYNFQDDFVGLLFDRVFILIDVIILISFLATVGVDGYSQDLIFHLIEKT